MMFKTEKLSRRDRILDVAEALFAKKGFSGTSVREITDAADVRLASVNYYFKSKDNLYSEVLVRRASTLIDDRCARLKALKFDGMSSRQVIEAVIKAIIDPAFEKAASGDPGWRNYLNLIATESTYSFTRIDEHESVHHLKQNSNDFVQTLQQLSDYESDQKAHYAYQFIMGAVLFILTNNGRLNQLSGNKYSSDDYESIYPEFLNFLTQGTLALLSKSSPIESIKAK